MPSLRQILCSLLFCSLFFVPPARAWGPDGHRIVGAVAEPLLSAQAKAEVNALLLDEAEPNLAGVSNWADTIRSEENWRFTGPWHYLNLPDLGCDYQPARDCANGNCVIGAINAQLRVLADRSQPRQKRIEALKFVVHFVGDEHQPMHAGLRSDRGGNDFQISYQGEAWNLHSVWDSLILRQPLQHDGGWQGISQRLGSDTLVLARNDLPPRSGAREWAMESCKLIGSASLYPGRHKISSSYLKKHRPLAERRLHMAGVRLAMLLNAAFAAPAP
ncbi:MAG: S1/P1 nuclease [Xanthomonadaceae bacterium]|nr:S1/P1 nuclease [Xanthomonadaceae bacterium]MDP2184245.1 S1/P1 nuclease [Xanthomonadales bacterium]MDZ4114791.1 S1/P1 nuclease [Xanthomonadaceae bacterium]MDZ4377422.1 S1/P1 nuclease [Xanthomonadaceae bacterium]